MTEITKICSYLRGEIPKPSYTFTDELLEDDAYKLGCILRREAINTDDQDLISMCISIGYTWLRYCKTTWLIYS